MEEVKRFICTIYVRATFPFSTSYDSFFCHGADNRIVSTFFYKLTHEMKKILRVLQESIK